SAGQQHGGENQAGGGGRGQRRSVTAVLELPADELAAERAISLSAVQFGVGRVHDSRRTGYGNADSSFGGRIVDGKLALRLSAGKAHPALFARAAGFRSIYLGEGLPARMGAELLQRRGFGVRSAEHSADG